MTTWTREQTAELRHIADMLHMGCKEAEAKVIFQAADAIEELAIQLSSTLEPGLEPKIVCNPSEIVP